MWDGGLVAAGTAGACGWVGWCLGLLGGTGAVGWRGGVGARRLCGCLTAGLDARGRGGLVREWELGCLLLCLEGSRAGA